MKTMSAAAAVLLIAAAAAAQSVREVRVEKAGDAPADPGYVQSVVETRAGMPFDVNRAARDVRALERTGRFSSVAVRAEPAGDGAVAVVFSVNARPTIERLEIAGADEVGNRKVREWLALGVGDLVDDAKLAAAARRIQDEYAKTFYPEARLTWTMTPGAAPGTVRVAVTVKEGLRARVSAIRFAGAKVVAESDLTERMKQKRFRWYNPVHWFTGAGRLSEDDIRADAHALQRLYAERGHLDARVEGPEYVRSGGDRVALQFRITEGVSYRLASVAIEGVTLFPSNDIARVARLAPGGPASMAEIDAAREAILDYYGNRGYILTQVRPAIDAAAESGKADLRLQVKEGTKSKIRDIKIRGNVVTHDEVIRRELVVAPGEPFNRSRVRTSENRVRNLGYFSYVAATPEPAEEAGWHDLVLDVEEDRMGTAEAGVAFSSIDRLVGRVEIGHGNVDLGSWPPFGAGQKVRLGAEIGTRRQDYYLSFIEPYFLDQRLRLGVDLYSREASYYSSLYDVGRLGGQLSLEKSLARFYSVGATYGLEEIEISDVDEDASAAIQAEEGTRMKSSLELSLVRDTRDRTRLTTRGNQTRLSSTLAGGPLGADTDWYKLELRSSQYIPLWFGHVFLLRGHVGFMEEYGDATRVPLFDRFFLGGLYTVRAFEYRHIGPSDEEGEPLGGRSMAFASAEYTVPVYKMVRLAAFVDGGMVWEDPFEFDLDWNTGYGVGIRLDIPMMPLRLDYAWQIDADDYNEDDNGRFNIMFGYPF
ncbi:MAG: outer membrane protein assembly factor BamA [Lentisphaerae bacterium]|nr:outer membrane protein assembly factor BamA [Lentisphaerota bacterium]